MGLHEIRTQYDIMPHCGINYENGFFCLNYSVVHPYESYSFGIIDLTVTMLYRIICPYCDISDIFDGISIKKPFPDIVRICSCIEKSKQLFTLYMAN